jgi:hypothetical protein
MRRPEKPGPAATVAHTLWIFKESSNGGGPPDLRSLRPPKKQELEGQDQQPATSAESKRKTRRVEAAEGMG